MRAVVVSGLAAGLVLAACTGLKSAGTPEDKPDSGTTKPKDGGGPGDPIDDATAFFPEPDAAALMPIDAGAPPDDTECSGDAWTKKTKTRPECAPRQVKVVEATAIVQVNQVAIAHTAAGRVAIAYNAENAVDGKLHVAHWIAKAPTDAPVLIVRPAPDFEHNGYRSRLAATGPDTVQILTYDMSDIDMVGSLNVARLVDGKPLTDPEVVVPTLANPTEIGFVVDKTGRAIVTARVPTGTTTSRLLARAKAPGAAWADLPDIAADLLTKEAPRAGAMSLVADPSGVVHLLYHHPESNQRSVPRYHALAASTWSYKKTLDNNTLDGISGYSPSIATFGTRKYALYFNRPIGATVADLRLATWIGQTDTPQIEILEQQIPSPDASFPRYRAALAVDKYGLLHIAAILPAPDNKKGTLDYKRQRRIDGGGTKWLSEVVDPEVLHQDSDAEVDLVVDENARPHIAYHSGADNLVYYATRYDR